MTIFFLKEEKEIQDNLHDFRHDKFAVENEDVMSIDGSAFYQTFLINYYLRYLISRQWSIVT